MEIPNDEIVSRSTVAENDTFMRLGERFREGEASLDLAEGLCLLTVVLVLGMGIWLLNRWIGPGRKRPIYSPRTLFRQLCKTHRLSLAQRRVLGRIAAQHALEHPAQLFVDEALFDTAWSKAAPKLSREQAERLREKLFG